jgi:hypothetical protein
MPQIRQAKGQRRWSAGLQKLGVYSEAADMRGAGAGQFRFAHSGP